MDYNIDKDDSVEFRFDGSCRHEEAFCFAVTPVNARRHRRVFCPMNNHALPENHDVDYSPVYETAARVGTAWWVAALAVDLADISAAGRPVIGFDVVRRRQRDVRQESCWSQQLSVGSVDPRPFGHLLLSDSAIAPIALDWGPGRFEDNTVTVTLPPGRGSVRVSCEYRPRSSKPAPGPLPASPPETMVTAELREGAATEVSLALHVPATAPEGRIALRIDRGSERGEAAVRGRIPQRRARGDLSARRCFHAERGRARSGAARSRFPAEEASLHLQPSSRFPAFAVVHADAPRIDRSRST